MFNHHSITSRYLNPLSSVETARELLSPDQDGSVLLTSLNFNIPSKANPGRVQATESNRFRNPQRDSSVNLNQAVPVSSPEQPVFLSHKEKQKYNHKMGERLSRERKRQKKAHLQTKISELQLKNTALKNENARLSQLINKLQSENFVPQDDLQLI